MSSYVTRTITVRPDKCNWHYRTSDGSSSAGSFFTNEDNYKINYIWDNNTDSFARIVDYGSPKSTWGVASFHLNTSAIPRNARPWSVAIKSHIVYGSTLLSNYYAGASVYTYAPSFSEAIKTQPTLELSPNTISSMTASVSGSWENYRSGCNNNLINLVYRLRCGSSLDTYRRFNELYTEWTCRIYSFAVSTSNVEGGTVQGTGIYEDLSNCTLTAVPEEGYEFVSWDNGITNISFTFTVNSDIKIVPTFKKKTIQITVESENSEYGEVNGTGSYEYNSSVTISATAKDGYRFSHWSDGDTNSTRTVTVTAQKKYTAYFIVATPIIVSVKLNPNPANLNQGYLIAVEVK